MYQKILRQTEFAPVIISGRSAEENTFLPYIPALPYRIETDTAAARPGFLVPDPGKLKQKYPTQDQK